MGAPEENIKTILTDWLDALRRHDFAAVERRIDPDVFWQGVREDFVCHNRDEAMEMLREQQREEQGVEALELIATEEKVVLGVRSTQLQEIGGVQLGGQIFQVFTLRHHDGRIVRVDEYRRRSEALEAAGAEDRRLLSTPGLREERDQPTMECLSRIFAPTLFLVGECDDRDNREIASILASRLPCAEKKVFAGCGHLVNLEQPVEFISVVAE